MKTEQSQTPRILTTVAVLLLATACGGSQKAKDDRAAEAEEPASFERCYEGEYRIFDGNGVFIDNSLVAAKYTVGPDEIITEDVERGGDRTEDAYSLSAGTARTESEGFKASGTIERSDEEVVLDLEGALEGAPTRTLIRIAEDSVTSHWHVQAEETDTHLVETLVRVPDDQCEARFEAVADGRRTAQGRVLDLLLKDAAAHPKAGVVKLTYDWPSDIEATVWADNVEDNDGETIQVRTPYVLETTKTDGGLQIEVAARFASALRDGTAPAAADSIAALDLLLYPFVADEKGAVASIVDYDQQAELVRTTVSKQVGDERAAKLVENMYSPDGMKQEVATVWNPLVAFWTGGELEIGRPYGAETEQMVVIPFGGRTKVKSNIRFFARGWVPCHRNDETRDCVLLELRQRTDPEYVKALLKSLMEKTGNSEEAPELVGYDSIYLAYVVAKPGTLVPYEFSDVRRVSVTMDDGNGPQTRTKTESKVLTFHYD